MKTKSIEYNYKAEIIKSVIIMLAEAKQNNLDYDSIIESLHRQLEN